MSENCSPTRDFLRHIANKVIAEYSKKIAAGIIEDVRNHLGKAEDKYKFSIYGGDPRGIIAYLKSEDWKDLVDYAANTNSLELLRDILVSLAKEYSEDCPQVAEVAEREAAEIVKSAAVRRTEDLDPSKVYRILKMSGYRVVQRDNIVEIDEGLIRASIKVEKDSMEYTICKSGKAKTLDGVLSKISKIREL